MAIDPLSIGVAAGVSALSPVVAKGIGSLFGLDELSDEERQAAQLRQQAIDRLTAQAEGRTASPAQLAAIAQQQRTLQALQGLAQRGSVQQRAGNLRTAMQVAPEVMAQQGATAAQARAQEMESARNALAQMQMASAAQQAASGRANREYMQRIVGAGVSGAGAIAGQGMLMSAEDDAKKTADAAKKTADAAKPAVETATTSQAQTAAPATAPVAPAPRPSPGVTSAQATRALGFDAGTPSTNLRLGAGPSMVAGGAAGNLLDQSMPQVEAKPQIRSLAPRMVAGGAAGGFEEPDAAALEFSNLQHERRGKGGFVRNAMSGVRPPAYPGYGYGRKATGGIAL